MNYWMIEPSFYPQLIQVSSATIDPEILALEDISAAEPVDVVAGVARIKIEGMLVNERSRVFDMFGIPHTSYADITAQVREADSNPAVTAIELQIDSGGGSASNTILETAKAIADTTKPTTAVVGNMAASAAYWLATQADTITLAGEATMVGSIGVAVQVRVSDDVVTIASTDAPRKRPDARTEEGQADIRRPLDGLHKLFVSAVSRGRGVDAETVNEDFGRGGILLATEAVSAGMADSIVSIGPIADTRVILAAMDIETLKRDHPALHASIVSTERNRCCAHLTLGEASGALKISIGHIRDGSEPDSTVQAVHTAANMVAVNEAARVAAQAPVHLVAAGPTEAATAEAQEIADVKATFELAGRK